MPLSLILLQLSGAVVLLLYAVHLVRSGVERAFAGVLRYTLQRAGRGRAVAAAGGAAMAIMLQSSTAVALLSCSFALAGTLPVTTGIAMLLGADLGSAAVVRVLSFDLGWLVPVCLTAGGIMYLKFASRRIRETGRMILGIGFILLSLQLIAAATAPLREGSMLLPIISLLARDDLLAFAIGAVFTWIVHSSVASVLMMAAFAGEGLLPLEAAMPMMLGANLGGGFIAFWLSRGMPAEPSRLPLANLLFRAAGSLAALGLIETFSVPTDLLGGDAGEVVVNGHLAFNALLLILSLPLVGRMERLVAALQPAGPSGPDQEALFEHPPSRLDRSAIGNPGLALASATRELLRMGELVEAMVRPVMDLIWSGNSGQIRRVQAIEKEVNRIHTDIKLYLAEVNRGDMSAEEAQRSIDLTDFAINLEHAGDIVAKNLLVLAEERAEKDWHFSPEGWSELRDLHQRVIENMHLALNVLVSQDLRSARRLMIEKERMRELARESHDRHLKRLQSGTEESIRTSGMHLEIIRGLKEINSLLATVAYPILQRSGDLLSSRLAQPSAS